MTNIGFTNSLGDLLICAGIVFFASQHCISSIFSPIFIFNYLDNYPFKMANVFNTFSHFVDHKYGMVYVFIYKKMIPSAVYKEQCFILKST